MRPCWLFLTWLLYLCQTVWAQSNNAIVLPEGASTIDAVAGQPLVLNWTNPSSGTITIKLQQDPVTPDSGIVLATGIRASALTATLQIPGAEELNIFQYTIQIIDDTDPDNFNFSPNFGIQGATDTAVDSSSTANTSQSSSSTTTTTTTTTTPNTSIPPTSSNPSSTASSPTFSTQSTGDTPSNTSQSLPSGSGADPQTVTQPQSSNNGGLSTGAVAGIAIGAVLAGFVAACLLFWFMRRSKQRKNKTAQSPVVPNADDDSQPKELSATDTETSQRVEFGSAMAGRHELDGIGYIHEKGP